MSTLELYRSLIPDHAPVLDGVITARLELAAKRHDASRWGNVYAEAMVYYAAHLVEMTPGSGAPGAPSSGSVQGPLISQRDGDLSRTYAAPATSSTSTEVGTDAWLMLTSYGQQYLDLRNTREATMPRFVRPPLPVTGRWPWRG